MKRIVAATLMLVMLAGEASAGEMRVFVEKGAMSRSMAERLALLLCMRYPEEKWTFSFGEESGETLLERVLADDTPDMAICSPQEAAYFADEGLLLDMCCATKGLVEIQEQAARMCTRENTVFMAPIRAKQRKIAVNRRLMEAMEMDGYLSEQTHPVWYTTELALILEGFGTEDGPAMEIWPADAQNCAGIEAFLQGISLAVLLSPDGEKALPDLRAMEQTFEWIGRMTSAGLIGIVQSRDEALSHFLEGKTAIFADWTEEERETGDADIREHRIELMTKPYPSMTGEILRSFELTGICGFAGEDEKNERILEAAGYLFSDEQVTAAIGGRGLENDGTTWLPCMDMDALGRLTRQALCEAERAVILEGADAQDAVRRMEAVIVSSGK